MHQLMVTKVKEGKIINVCDIEKASEIETGLYLLKEFDENRDYCALEKCLWIYAISKSKAGQYFAFTLTGFILHKRFCTEPYEIIWER